METRHAQPPKRPRRRKNQQPVDWFLFLLSIHYSVFKERRLQITLNPRAIMLLRLFGKTDVRKWYTHEAGTRQTVFTLMLDFFFELLLRLQHAVITVIYLTR